MSATDIDNVSIMIKEQPVTSNSPHAGGKFFAGVISRKHAFRVYGILISCLLGTLIGIAWGPLYSFSSIIRIGQISGQLLEKIPVIVYNLQNPAVHNLLFAKLHIENTDEKPTDVHVEATALANNFVKVVVSSHSKARSVAVAKALLDQFTETHQQIFLTNESILKEQVVQLQQDVATLRQKSEQGLSRLNFQEAEMKGSSSPNFKVQNVPIGEDFIQGLQQKVVDLRLSLVNQSTYPTSVVFEKMSFSLSRLVLCIGISFCLSALFLLGSFLPAIKRFVLN